MPRNDRESEANAATHYRSYLRYWTVHNLVAKPHHGSTEVLSEKRSVGNVVLVQHRRLGQVVKQLPTTNPLLSERHETPQLWNRDIHVPGRR